MNFTTTAILALLSIPLASHTGVCDCLRNWTENSGAGSDGKMSAANSIPAATHDPEQFVGQLDVDSSDDGLCNSGSNCTAEPDPCNWGYDIDLDVTQDPAREQISYFKHRESAYALNGADELTITKDLARNCGDAKLIKVNAYDQYNVQIATVSLGTLACIQCTEIE